MGAGAIVTTKDPCDVTLERHDNEDESPVSTALERLRCLKNE